jgi:hypothetical protein
MSCTGGNKAKHKPHDEGSVQTRGLLFLDP